jgi:sulfoxide reductase heme-binding subunit YedZ
VNEALWYLGRGSGLMALLLLSVSTALGIATSTGRVLPGLPRFAVTALHRNASLTAVVFLAVHIGTLLFDPYAQLRLADIIVPFTGAYRSLWLGLGTLASDLLLAVVVTSLLRHRIGLRTWRAVHWTAYAAWPIGLVHAIGTATDTAQAWFWGSTVFSVSIVVTAFVWRLIPAAARS